MKKSSYSDIEGLLAKEAIRSVLYRFCRAIDRGDQELFASLVYPDAVFDHSRPMRGDVFVQEGLERLKRQWNFTHHMLGQIHVELDADGADSEAYILAHHVTRAEDGAPARMVSFGGRYLDRFECRDTEWRILRRVLVKDWYEVRPYQPELGPNFHPNFHLPSRDRFDPVYRPAEGEHIRRG